MPVSDMTNKGKDIVAHTANTDRWAVGFKIPVSRVKKTET